MTAPTRSLDELYESYRADPTPDNLGAAVTAARPIIRYALASVNGLDNPKLESRAKLFAAEAIRKFDPTRGASVKTHISNNLMQIRRAAREMSTPVRVPERAQLDSNYLQRKHVEFLDARGREPDTAELADFAKMPVKKIKALRQAYRPVPSEAAAGEIGEGTLPSQLEEAMDYVFSDADHIDRRILEMRAGYGGHEILPAHQVGAMLGLTPSQLSRRAAIIGSRIHETGQLLESR